LKKLARKINGNIEQLGALVEKRLEKQAAE
jgi:hypothetical protein